MGCPTGLVTAVAAVFISPGALLTPTPKIALFGRIPRAGGVKQIHVNSKRLHQDSLILKRFKTIQVR